VTKSFAALADTAVDSGSTASVASLARKQVELTAWGTPGEEVTSARDVDGCRRERHCALLEEERSYEMSNT
jgi:hypothetical protein